MGNSYINISVHIIFHIKSTGCVMREEDLPEISRYIGGVIRSMSGHAYMVVYRAAGSAEDLLNK